MHNDYGSVFPLMLKALRFESWYHAWKWQGRRRSDALAGMLCGMLARQGTGVMLTSPAMIFEEK